MMPSKQVDRILARYHASKWRKNGLGYPLSCRIQLENDTWVCIYYKPEWRALRAYVVRRPFQIVGYGMYLSHAGNGQVVAAASKIVECFTAAEVPTFLKLAEKIAEKTILPPFWDGKGFSRFALELRKKGGK